MLGVEYDRTANAIYFLFSDKPYAHGVDLDPERRIDYAADSTVIGVELLCVDHGVQLADLPHADEIAAVLEQYRIKVFA